MKILFQLMFLVLIFLSLILSLTPIATTVPTLWNDKLIHFMSYFLLMMMFDFSCWSGERLLVKALLVVVYSYLIEYGQSFVPGREMSFDDVLANGAGVLLFLLLVPLLKRVNGYQVLRLV